MPAEYTRKDEDRDFARTRDFAVEREYHATHPYQGPKVPPDPMADAVWGAGSSAIREYGEAWDEQAFLEALAVEGYRVVPVADE